MAIQKKLTNEIGTFNYVIGVTEAEANYLPNAEEGFKTLDEGFEVIYDYDILDKIVIKYQKKFSKEILSKISTKSFKKIYLGLKSYAKTPKSNKNLNILKASILNTFGFDLLTYNFKNYKSEINHISDEYFENLGKLGTIKENKLIPSKDIEEYVKLAREYTALALLEFSEKSDMFDMEDEYLYRGLANKEYYKSKVLQKCNDFISRFNSDISLEYYERNLLNSYSLNRRVAEKFMMYEYNQRKAFLKTNLEEQLKNVFSSFIVSDTFLEGQYEILCLPMQEEKPHIKRDNQFDHYIEFEVYKNE